MIESQISTQKGTATKLFHRLEQRLGEQPGSDNSFADTIAFQIGLARNIEALLAGPERSVRLADSLLGKYQKTPTTRPHSSTGEIIFVHHPDGTKLALKILRKLDPMTDDYLDKPDPVYVFNPVGRMATTIGETLMGKLANRHNSNQPYLGVAAVTSFQGNEIELQRLSVKKVLRGQQEPVIVMQYMELSLADVLLQKAETGLVDEEFSPDVIEGWTRRVVQQVIDASVPLSDEHAAKIGSPTEIHELLTERTIGWLAGRPEKNTAVQTAAEQAREVVQLFEQFFRLPETENQLKKRAKGYVGEGANQRLAQTFSPGDAKLGNLLINRGNNGRNEIGLFDPQWLVVRSGFIGNENPTFAPWPFADLLQVTAFTATQAAAYGFPELSAAIRDEVQRYYGKEHWSNWHELYFSILTAYKLLVDAACNVDAYMEKMNAGQSISSALRYTVEVYPQTALNIATTALEEYRNRKVA
jgi:hypothetical protein